MAADLCCMGQGESRSDSPELPNARISQGITPAKKPLLPKQTPSPGSQCTTASPGSQDLHELHEIFRCVNQSTSDNPPSKKTAHARIARPSIYNLQRLPKIKSVQALIRKKLSKDLSKSTDTPTSKHPIANTGLGDDEPDTVVKVPRGGPNSQLKVTKDDLKRNLLSDKNTAEGGYDSDAEVLDDVARKVGKSASKRPSLHSIDWSSSPGKNEAPASNRSSDMMLSKPYQLDPIRLVDKVSVTGLWNQYASSPNLQAVRTKEKDRNLRRSHSATSVAMLGFAPLSQITLPNMDSRDQEEVPWSVSTAESLHLSQFPSPPSNSVNKAATWSSRTALKLSEELSAVPKQDHGLRNPIEDLPYPPIRIQEPTASPRPSSSLRNSPPVLSAKPDDQTNIPEEEDNPRRSVHLDSMRISHHLRSGSLLSWDNLSDAPSLPHTLHPLRQFAMSSNYEIGQLDGSSRHDRQKSSSGFVSSKVPSKWGNVIPSGHDRFEASSIYSSRPHSPPDSLIGSTGKLPLPTITLESLKVAGSNPRGSNYPESDPTDNEETPRPPQRHGVTFPKAKSEKRSIFSSQPTIARNNSVATTKMSKFREEFSPSPPRKRSMPTLSIMKKRMLRHRASVRSQSDTNLKVKASTQVDGPFDSPQTTPQTERASRSLLSLQKEEASAGSEKELVPVWERALKQFQDERSSLFLSGSGKLSTPPTAIRERSSSVSRQRRSSALNVSPTQTSPDLLGSKDNVCLDDESSDRFFQSTRRLALMGAGADTLQAAFDKQKDDRFTLGAWGRFPSHTREERNASAGHLDRVVTRDFALEAAIRFANGEDETFDPSARRESPVRSGKKKKRTGTTRMSKSNSMTFGKEFFKSYGRMFRSQSTEFQRHGHGHRSSVATGGTLQHPELELLPEIWRKNATDHDTSESSNKDDAAHDGSPKLKGGDSMATLRPAKHADVADTSPGLHSLLDGNVESKKPTGGARVWSVFYEDCIPNFPRASTDAVSLFQPNLKENMSEGDTPTRTERSSNRQSVESRRTGYSKTLPARLGHGKQMSRSSAISKVSIVPSFCSASRINAFEDEDEGEEDRSIVSVRKSTMDLVTMFKEQETVERDRVLSLMRVESYKSTS